MKNKAYTQAVMISDRVSLNDKTGPYWPTEGWRTSTPEAQGMHSVILAEMLGAFQERNVHSVAIVRNGYLVAEAYNQQTQFDIPQDVKSVTKSITSALTGIALSERKLKSIEQRVAEFFPVWSEDPVRSKIMIKHLLYMVSGLDWNNVNEQASTDMMYSADWIQSVLEHPSRAHPGTIFNYSNGDAHLLSAILHKATGESMFDYAKTHLFRPLGISNVNWNEDPQGHTIGAWAMALTLRDMAKLGYLYMKEGQWDGETIIPKPWIKETLIQRVTQNYANGTQGGYGYYWWLKSLAPGIVRNSKKPIETFYASGAGGQRIFVIPSLQLVVALTSNSMDVDMPEQLLHHVAKAIRSDKVLSDNAEATSKLNQAIETFKTAIDQ
ncbi:serine hydrolase [Paenibacillus sp. N3.4]|uniref:serine hydrolase domain-containing protein n=1 Tax=Paenibacillus sp. N3.4 TaxID=2603222 RepID=UPI0011C8AC7C|nr:serine hydrolase [Paenibacillus sp. N3.4]TXK84515.1 serine hydrolase [Paenibacillus sp. N3.4]